MSDTGIKLLKAEQQKIIKEAIKYFSVHKLGDNPNDIDILKLQEFFDLKCDIINKQNATNQKVEFKLNSKVNSTADNVNAIGGYNTDENGKPIVELDSDQLTEGLYSSDKNERLRILAEIYMMIDHELTHYEQDLIIDNSMPTSRCMNLTRDKLFLNFEKFYSDNYWNYRMEDEAYRNSAANIQELVGDESDFIKDYVEHYKNFYDAQHDIGKYKYVSEGDRDEILQQLLDNTICKNLYPNHKQKIMAQINNGECQALKYEYNLSEGRRKTVDELVEQMDGIIGDISKSSSPDKDKQIEDVQNMHYEMIYRTMKKTTTEQMQEVEKKLGKDRLESIYNNMSKYYDQKKDNQIQKLEQKVEALKALKAKNRTLPEELQNVDINGNYDKYQQMESYQINKYFDRKLQNIDNLRNGKNMTAGLDSNFASNELFDPEKEQSVLEPKQIEYEENSNENFEDFEDSISDEFKVIKQDPRMDRPVKDERKGPKFSIGKIFGNIVGSIFELIIGTISGNAISIYNKVKSFFDTDDTLKVNNANNMRIGSNFQQKEAFKTQLKITPEELKKVANTYQQNDQKKSINKDSER